MTKGNNIVYYNGLWYSAHSPLGGNKQTIGLDDKRIIDRIKSDMRLLSLVFDEIHVPRSHFLTSQTQSHSRIVRQYLSDRDHKYFVDQKILVSSTRPFVDEYSDTERIVERSKSNNWAKDWDEKSIIAVRNIPSVKIDSIREATRNVDQFDEIIAIWDRKDKKVAKKLKEIRKRSTYGDIPFLHETFIEELLGSEAIDWDSKVEIWRLTNTVYMQSGCLDLGDNRRIVLNRRIEDGSAINDNSGTLRDVYSPQFLEALICFELGDKYLIKFLNEDIVRIMGFRTLESWSHFKDEIFEMFEVLTMIERVKPDEFAEFRGVEKILAYRKFLVAEKGNRVAALISGLAEIAAGGISPILGKTVKTGSSFLTEVLVKKYSDWKISGKMNHYNLFWKQVKSLLDKPDLSIVYPRIRQ